MRKPILRILALMILSLATPVLADAQDAEDLRACVDLKFARSTPSS